jgi:hypothetical protein
MNNTFDISRFGLLLKRQWLEFGKIYLITLGVAFGVIATFYLYSLWPLLAYDSDHFISVNFREPLFVIFGFLFITVTASNYFAQLGQKSKTIIELLLPASTFEKFLAGVFFTAVLSILGYIIVFYLTDLVFMSKLRAVFHDINSDRYYNYGEGEQQVVVDRYDYIFGALKREMFLPFYAAPLFVTSIFLLGSIYFNKYHYIKTAIAVMIFSGIATYLIGKTGELLMSNRRPIEMNRFIIGKDTSAESIILLIVLALTLVFWAITYVRLKEKEV